MEKELRILMLEDLQEDVGLIERTLVKQGMRFIGKAVDTREEFISALEDFHPDVILSDHALPQFNSLEALTVCNDANLNVPFILVTGTVSEEFAVSCLKHGADDYVLKSNLVRLPSAILNALRQRTLEFNRKKSEVTLRSQNEELVKINRELDSFVYSVSHNLRAPLMSVLGLLRLVELENEDDQLGLSHYFKMMQHSIHKLDETLKEILDYSRNARSELKLDLIDINKVFEESFEKMMYIEGSEQIKKRIEIDQKSELYLDHYRLSVVINNLISNAIKYKDSLKDVNTIDIACRVNAEQLEIIFRDNGIGIRHELLPKIFDMFYRATERSEGAGLGLYIVKESVEKMGGVISAESKIGEGTTFHISVPNRRNHRDTSS